MKGPKYQTRERADHSAVLAREGSDVKFHEIFELEIFHEIFHEIFQIF